MNRNQKAALKRHGVMDASKMDSVPKKLLPYLEDLNPYNLDFVMDEECYDAGN